MDKQKRLEIKALMMSMRGSWGARLYHLAYGLARGKPYLKMEKKCRHAPAHRAILHVLVECYGLTDWTLERVEAEVIPVLVPQRNPEDSERVLPAPSCRGSIEK